MSHGFIVYQTHESSLVKNGLTYESKIADIKTRPTISLFRRAEEPGNDSILSKYCKVAIDGGRAHCLWIYFDRHGRTIVEDVSVEIGNSNGG